MRHALEPATDFNASGAEFSLCYGEEGMTFRIGQRYDRFRADGREFRAFNVGTEHRAPASDGFRLQIESRAASVVTKDGADFTGGLNLSVFVVIVSSAETNAL